jgi:hypothetical protein
LSAWTGYRRKEIGSLSKRSFRTDSDPPTVTVAAAYSKRRRKDAQVLHPELVNRLVKWLIPNRRTIVSSVVQRQLLGVLAGTAPHGPTDLVLALLRLVVCYWRVRPWRESRFSRQSSRKPSSATRRCAIVAISISSRRILVLNGRNQRPVAS